jgi:pimeloyl-ACP methyl ester carboxylesterase
MVSLRLSVAVACLLLGMIPDTCFSSGDLLDETIVLIHGLGRTSNSLYKMENYLKQRGYDVLNIDYPSRKYDIRTLTTRFIRPAMQNHGTDRVKKVHFVTHSMGGIIVRYYLKTYPMANIGRVVMLSPPNQGSEVVDFLKDRTIVEDVMGPAFDQLSTDPVGFVNTLGDIDAEVGIITGNRSINWINSILIPGPDDGKVSVDRTRLRKMADFMVVKRTHSFIMNADEVLEAVIRFITQGRFRESD